MFFSYKKFLIKYFYNYFLKLFYYFNFHYKRFLDFRGKGNKFILKNFNNLFLSNEFSHSLNFSINFLNFFLNKYNKISLIFNNYHNMNLFLSLLENLRKKDLYKGKGIFDKNKFNKLKASKKKSSLF